MNFTEIYNLRYDKDEIAMLQKASLDDEQSVGVSLDDGLVGSEEWWSKISKGIIRTRKIQGVISRVYMSGHNDFPQFEIDDSQKKTTWIRKVSKTKENELSMNNKEDLFSVGKEVILLFIEQKSKDGLRISKRVLSIRISEH